MQGKSQFGWFKTAAVLVSVLGAAGSGQSVVAQQEDKPRVYAIAAGEAPYVVESDHDDRAYLGVTLEEETDWAEGGARITRVVDESPAAGAGLQKGDIIVRFNGETIRGPMALTKAIHETEPGDTVKLTVVRDGREQKFEIEMGEHASLWRQNVIVAPEWTENLKQRMEELGENMGRAFSCEGDDCTGFMVPPCEGDDCKDLLRWKYQFDVGRPLLGVELVEVTPELRRHLGAADDRGVLVGKVLSGTPAEQAGIRVGDLIVTVGGADIGDTGDLRGALREKRGESFTVEVIREKRTVRVEVTIPEPERERPTGPRAARTPHAPERAALPRTPPPSPPVAVAGRTPMAPPAAPSAMAGPTPMAPPAAPSAMAGPIPMAPPGPPAAVAGPAPMALPPAPGVPTGTTSPAAPAPPAAVPMPPDSRAIVEARRDHIEALRQAELALVAAARVRNQTLEEAQRVVEMARAEQAMVVDEVRQETRRAREEVQRALELGRAERDAARRDVRLALEAERQALREARSWMREVI